MLSWFFGALTRAILTIISSALGVIQVSSTFIQHLFRNLQLGV